MNRVIIDGNTINGEPLFVTGIYDMAVYLIDRMINEGAERCTLPLAYEADGKPATTMISLHRNSTLALHVEDDGGDVATRAITRAEADMNAIMTEIKASIAATDR